LQSHLVTTLEVEGSTEMATQQLSGSWQEIRGKIKERWGMLTDQELLQGEGNTEQLIGTIQRKTGESRRSIERALQTMSDEAEDLVRRAANTARDYAAAAQEQAGQAYEQVTGAVREGYQRTEDFVQRNPGQSVVVAFGAGVLAGLLVGVCLRRSQ
jgi:uncharacterized protein YjbJ (UPF0337 family)